MRGASLTLAFIALLVGVITGGTAIWFFKTETKTSKTETSKSILQGSNVDSEVVGTGRIDTLNPIIPLYPKYPGTVVKVLANPDLPVRKGSVLMEMDSLAFQRKASLAQTNVAAAKAALDAAEIEKFRFAYLVNQLKIAQSLAELERDNAQKELKQLKENQAKPAGSNAIAITDDIVELAETKVKFYQLKLDAAVQQVMHNEKTPIDAKVAEAKAAVEAANIQKQEAEDALIDCQMMAPGDGTILRVMVGPGSYVSPLNPVAPMLFAPTGQLVVRAELDQEYVGRVKEGYPATFRDESRPNSPSYEGTVLAVSKWIARPRSILFDPLEINDVRTAEVVIELKKGTKQSELQLGQRVRVRIKSFDY
jgi:multidrug resistance efflux pump